MEYFVSYYDYYQPEAYLPTTDTYIEKDSSINEQIDRMRHSATNSLFERNDVIVVASVSCIYGLGSPEAYHGMLLFLEKGQRIERNDILRKLVDIQYERNDFDFHRGTFRVRGDVVEIFPASYESTAIRIELFGDEIDSISEFDPLLGTPLQKLEKVAIYPDSHYVIPESRMKAAIDGIHEELRERIQQFRKAEQADRGAAHRAAHHVRPRDDPGDGLLPRHRELLAPSFRTGARRAAADAARLLPQGLSPGRRRVPRHDPADRRHVQRRPGAEDEPRGIRLPPALGAGQPAAQFRGVRRAGAPDRVCVGHAGGLRGRRSPASRIIEQVIRPTGLTDPEIAIRPAKGQVDDLLNEVRKRAEAQERVLVTTLTKRMAEDLTEHYKELNVKVAYLHSDIDTLERVDIIRDLRMGKYDVLIGINLLREGLDIPEVSLVAILDADKEGFLRSTRSLIQTMGRAARHVNGEVILYAEKITDSMRNAINETNRRRTVQEAYNKKHNITPQSIKKNIQAALRTVYEQDYFTVPIAAEDAGEYLPTVNIPAAHRVARETDARRGKGAGFRDRGGAAGQDQVAAAEGNGGGGEGGVSSFESGVWSSEKGVKGKGTRTCTAPVLEDS